ncbi:MAG: hypothetical protein KH452_11480 [Clostridiales bacterium]|nr:hypothetical protein [Clostridiales bacterium]
MKKKGHFVAEAAVLIPAVCVLLVQLVFFTLYVHDYAVCRHAAIESGIKGSYPDGRTDRRREYEIREDLERKLQERLLWMQDPEVEAEVNPVQMVIRIKGAGNFLPVDEIEVRQKIFRIKPCESVRRSRWLKG